MKLSIIIPVYRVEDTLDKCVESVLKQDYDNMEIILVDDGSPDNCPQKCDDWARKDTRIRVIHKANGGLSDARNAALDIVQGDYITFVDSDDFISLSTYGPLMDTLSKRQDINILEYPVFINYRSTKQRKLDFTEETVYDNISDYWYKGQAYLHSYACNKIYRASLFEEIRFPRGIVFEDIHTLPLPLPTPSPISSLPCKGIPKPLILSLWGVCAEELGGFLAFSAASSEFSFLRLRVPTHPSALRLPEF